LLDVLISCISSRRRLWSTDKYFERVMLFSTIIFIMIFDQYWMSVAFELDGFLQSGTLYTYYITLGGWVVVSVWLMNHWGKLNTTATSILFNGWIAIVPVVTLHLLLLDIIKLR